MDVTLKTSVARRLSYCWWTTGLLLLGMYIAQVVCGKFGNGSESTATAVWLLKAFIPYLILLTLMIFHMDPADQETIPSAFARFVTFVTVFYLLLLLATYVLQARWEGSPMEWFNLAYWLIFFEGILTVLYSILLVSTV